LHDLAENVAAELITNAIEATRATCPGARVRLTLVADHASVLVIAWDAVPLPPAPASPGPDSESGRGLLIVDALTAWWDCKPVPAAYGGGKLVRAMVTRNPRA
jgi:anti-sigma regulatory factor (Ser/Thr protein kinase)